MDMDMDMDMDNDMDMACPDGCLRGSQREGDNPDLNFGLQWHHQCTTARRR
jgi:hypothetical protein